MSTVFAKNDILRSYAHTKSVLNHLAWKVAIPLAPMAVLLLLLNHFVPLDQASNALLGKGQLLLFAVLLLLGVLAEIKQAATFATQIGGAITCDHAEYLLLVLVVYLLLFYGYSVGFIAYHEYVQPLPAGAFSDLLYFGTVIGAIGAVSAVAASVAGILWVIRALSTHV